MIKEYFQKVERERKKTKILRAPPTFADNNETRRGTKLQKLKYCQT